jgi:hypothetical protein
MSHRAQTFTVRGLMAAAALLLLSNSATFAAEDGGTQITGPVIALTGSGGDINAAGATVDIQGETGTVRAAGANVTVRTKASGDLWVAGADVVVAGSAATVHAGGADVLVSADSTGDMWGLGAVLRVNSRVGGSLHLGGASVVVGSATDVTHDLEVGGAKVRVGGHIGGTTKAGGALVVFDGRADGPVTLAGYSVVVSANARIGGDLTVISANEPVIADGAVVSGQVVRKLPPRDWTNAPWVWRLAVALWMALGTIVAGVVLMLFGARVFAASTEHVRHRPLSSFLFGILTIVLVPFVALVLVATFIGLTAGFAVGLILPFLVVFGHAVAAAGIAGGILIRRRGEVGGFLNFILLVVGAFVLVALGLIPVVGPIIVIIAMLLGLGAFARTVGHRLRQREPAAATE